MNQETSVNISNPGDKGSNTPFQVAPENQTTEATTNSDKHSYGQILKSSAIIGGSTVINIGIRMIRTKAMALMLGPSGVGLMGLYESIMDLTQSVVGMGVNSSGVRQIAEAMGSEDATRIAKTAKVLQRTSVFLALLGTVFLFGFSSQLSKLTFGDNQHASGVALLALAVFFNLLAAGQGALIQGMRRISDLAKMSILGTLYGVLISIPVIYVYKEDGVALSIVLVAGASLMTSWWYKRKITIPVVSMTSIQIGKEQADLLKLGFAFMSSGLMMTGAAYVIRLLIVRVVGFDAAGLYQSAWGLGGLYIGFILQAMGTDFYPRLTGVIHDHEQSNRLVNEQAHVSLLLAGPGVLGTLTFAPLVIMLFYSSAFTGAIELLRWICLGMTLRVISWPMGFIIVAKNNQKLFFLAELAWTSVYLGLAWICITTFGTNGAGIAFLGSYIFHVVMIYCIVRQLTCFRWSTVNLKTSFFYLALISAVFGCFYVFPSVVAIGIGLLATILSSVYSVRAIVKFIPPDRIPRRLHRLLVLFRFADSGTGLGQKTTDNKSGVSYLKRLIIVLIVLSITYLVFWWYQNPQTVLELVNFYLLEFNNLLTKVKNIQI